MSGVWSRVPVTLAWLAVLIYFADAGPRSSMFDEKNGCVDVKVFTPKKFFSMVSVGKCEFVEYLRLVARSLQDNVTALEEKGRQAVAANDQKIKVLQKAVDELQGDNSFLFRLAYTDPRNDRRPFCEIFSFGEASEICQLLGFQNPNVYFVHLNCEKPNGDRSDCPRRFWKLRPACFKPNDAITIPNAPSPFFQCIRDPDPSETCDRLVWISCEGYTNNFNQDYWREMK